MPGFPELNALVVLGQVLVIDLMLTGDNAIVVGLAVIRLPPEMRRRAILLGVIAAALIRFGLALIAIRLLAVVGLLFAGGLLLLWLCWRMYRDLRSGTASSHQPGRSPRSLSQVVLTIVLADMSMSLDNVLAVAGAARSHPAMLAIGLCVSIALMGFAADRLAALLVRHRFITWFGLSIVLYVAMNLIWEGGQQILRSISV